MRERPPPPPNPGEKSSSSEKYIYPLPATAPAHPTAHPTLALSLLLRLLCGMERRGVREKKKTNTNLQLIFIMFLRCLQTNRLNVPILPKREPLLRPRSAPN